MLFQVASDESALRVRRYATAYGIGHERQALATNFDAVDIAMPVSAIAAAPSGEELVVVGGSDRNHIVWLGVNGKSLTRLAEGTIDDLNMYPFDVALSGDTALRVGEKQLVRVRRDGSAVVGESFVDTQTNLRRLLHFDGQRATVAAWGSGVEVYDADGAVIAAYDTGAEVQSMAVVGTQLVFGMNDAVLLAEPQCAP